MQYNVEWDLEKARLNKIKHGVTFELGASIFHDPRALSIYDVEHSESEERWITIGIAKNGVLLVLCHTMEEDKTGDFQVRIFSSRKATKNETLKYKDTAL